MPKKLPAIYIVSDGRGETATQLVRAAVVQFEGGSRYRLVRKAGIRSPDQVEQAVEQARASNAVIFYTLVSEETRQTMIRAANDRRVTTVDILGPALGALHDLFKSESRATPGLLYALEHDRFDRMEAIDYTLKHDDGRRLHELSGADVVLVGVSRASKSSTCFFLAYQGVRAANVPLIPGIEPPYQLLRLPPERVIGLRMNVSRLMTVREARARSLNLGQDDPYIEQRSLAAEIGAADRIIHKHGWRCIDASYMAVEEIAREVMRLCDMNSGGLG